MHEHQCIAAVSYTHLDVYKRQEHLREMARKMEIGLVLRVDRDNRIFVTEALRKRLAFIGQTPEMTVVE